MSKQERIELAENILRRDSKTAQETLKVMGFSIEQDKPVLKNDEEW